MIHLLDQQFLNLLNRREWYRCHPLNQPNAWAIELKNVKKLGLGMRSMLLFIVKVRNMSLQDPCSGVSFPMEGRAHSVGAYSLV